MIDHLMNVVRGMIKEHQVESIREKKLDAELALVFTLYRLNLVSTKYLKEAKLTHIMAKHLERISH